jgi:hypothetical protein
MRKHLTHVLHQLQNAMGCVLCCLFVFPTFPMGFGLCYSTGAQAGWSPVLFRVMQA